MLGLGLNLSILYEIHILTLYFCISEFVYSDWCWRHESESQMSSMMSQWIGHNWTLLWGNFQQKFTGESDTYIIFILFYLWWQKTEILLQKIVILWHLVGKAPYNKDNKLNQLTHKIFDTTFLSTMHMGYNFSSSSFFGQLAQIFDSDHVTLVQYNPGVLLKYKSVINWSHTHTAPLPWTTTQADPSRDAWKWRRKVFAVCIP